MTSRRLRARHPREGLPASSSLCFDADEAALIERMLREYGGVIPDAQLIEEIGLALVVHRLRSPSNLLLNPVDVSLTCQRAFCFPRSQSL